MEPNTSKDEEDDEDIIAAELREDTEIYCPFLQKCIAKAEGKQLTDLNRVYRFLNDKSLRSNRTVLLKIRANVKDWYHNWYSLKGGDLSCGKTNKLALQKCGSLENMGVENSAALKKNDETQSLVSSTSVGEEENENSAQKASKGMNSTLANKDGDTAKLTTLATECAGTVSVCKEVSTEAPSYASDSFEAPSVNISCNDVQTFGGDRELSLTPDNDTTLCKSLENARHHDHTVHEGRDLNQILEKPEDHVVIDQVDSNFNFGNEKQDEQLKSITHLALGPSADKLENALVDVTVSNENRYENSYNLQGSTCGVTSCNVNSSSQSSQASVDASNTIPGDNTLSVNQVKEPLLITNDDASSDVTGNCNQAIKSSLLTSVLEVQGEIKIDGAPEVKEDRVSPVVEEKSKKMSSNPSDGSTHRHGKLPPLELMPWRLRPIDVLKSFRPKSQPTEDKSIKQMTPPPATTEETNVESSSSSSDKEASHVQFNNEDLKSLLSWVTKRNASGESLPMNVDNISLSIKVENTTASECMSKTSSATDTIDSNNRKFYRDPRPFHLLHESDTTTSQTPSLLPTPPIQTPNPNTAPVCIDLEDEEEESKPKGPPLIHRKSHDRYNAMMEAEKKKSEEIEKERLASQKAQWSAWQLKHYNRQNINISRVNNYINYNIRGVLNGPPSNISLPVRPLLSVPPPALLPVSPLSPLLPPPPPYSTHASPLHPTLPAGIKSYPVGAVMQGNMTDPLQLPQVSQSSNLPSAASSRDPRLAKRANASIHGALPAGVTQGCGQDPSSPLTKITYCLHCKWQGSPDHSLDHYVNVHPDKDPPVRLSKDQLEEALYERDAALRRNVDEKTPTGVRWLDDLSWIPVGSVFLIPQKCKLCSFTTNIRCSLIQHVYNHRQMMLAPASCSTIVGDDSTYRCRFCEMTTKSMEEFHKHCTLHTGEYLFACGGCPDFRGPTREDVQKHIQEKHAGRNTSIKFNDKVKLQGRTLNGHMCSDCLFLQLNEMKVQNHVTYAHYPRPAEVIKVNMSKRFLQPCNTTPLTQPKEPDPVLPQKHTSMTPSSTVLPTPLASLLHSSVETTAQSSANGLQIAVTTATSDEPDQQAHAASRGPVRRPPPVKIRDDPRRAVSKLGDGTINKDVTNTMSPSRKSPKAKKGDNLKVKSAKQKATKKSGPRNKKSLQGEVGTPSSFTSQRLNVPTQRSSGFNYQDIHSSALNTDEADEVVVPLELGTMECEVGPVFENNNYNETNEPDYMNVESHQGDPIVESVVSERNSSGYDSDASTDTVEMNLNSNDQVLGVETAPVYQVKTEPVDITEKHQECHRRVSVHEEASSPGFRVDQTGGSVPSIADTILKLDAQLRAGRTQTAASQVIPANELLATSKSSLPNVDGVVKDVAVTPKKAKNWSERQKVIICSCLFAARSTEAFVRHRECWHKGEKRCTCPECHNRFDTAASYAEHLWTACPKSRMYACAVESLCRFTTSSPNHFVTHIKEEHLNIPWLPCYWCGSTYNTPECLVVHIQNKCSLRTPLMNALMKNAATLSAPAIELPATSESEGTRCAIRGPKDSRPDYTGVCSPEDSTAPHLEIVYRCSVPQCAHQSLEREVFIDHVQVDHPEKTVHVCHDCGENFQSLFSLVLHIEKHHREGCLGRNSSDEQAETHTATVSVTPKTLTILSSRSCTSASTPPERNIVEPERMPVVESGLSPSRESPDPQTDTSSEQTTSSNTPVSHNYSSHVGERPSTSPVGGFTDSAQADRMLTNSLALASSSGHGDDGEEGAKTVKLDTVANLCKFVALTCEVIFSRNVDTSRLDEMLVQWNEANRRQNCSFVIPELRIVDPLKFPLTLKTSAALSSMLSEQGLVNLYKCPGKECQFTSNDEDEFQCHLEMGTCHTKDRLLQCLYCGERHLTVWGAVAHLSQQHGSAVFQCPDCIFRSSRNLYVILHIVLEHPQHRGHARVIKCKNPIKDGDCAITNNPEDDLPSLLSVILPIPCTFDGCKFLTVDPGAFNSHLSKSHPDAEASSCFFCGVSFRINELIGHLESHRIFKFHCRYCGYGTHNGNDIVLHLCCKHPHATGRVFIREYEAQQQKQGTQSAQCPVELNRSSSISDQIPSSESLARVVANIKREKDDTVVDKNVPETETPAIDIVSVTPVDNREETPTNIPQPTLATVEKDVVATSSPLSPSVELVQPTAATLEKELEAPLTSRDTHGAQTLTDVLQPTSCVPQAPTTSRSLPRTCLGRETPRGFLAMATTSSRFRVFQTMPVPIPSTGSSVVSHSPAKARKSLSSQNPSRVFSSGRVLRDFVTTTTTTTTNTKTITQRPSSSSEVTIVNLQQSPSIQRTQSGSAAPTAAAAASTPTTGGSDIYVESASVSCGYQPCRFSANTIKELEVHMSKCVYRNSSTWLTCKQCCMPFRTVPELLNDLRTHQTKIYLCGLCGYETDLPHYVKKHLKETHCLQFDDTKYVQRVNPDTGRSECVYQPVVRNMRIRISPEAGGGAIIASGPSTSSSSFATNTGSLTTSGASAKNLVVADFDAVPRQSIFTNDVKCALCNYSTKVRRNLIRHLAQHKEDTVNKTNNAVQGSCAESRSSTSSSEPNPGLQKLFYPKQVPDYIPLRRRYECGIDGCGHLENDGTSYVEHLSSVHPNALGYPCPHCDDMYDTQSDFIMHLYLHGPNLYKCHYCTYVNNERYIVLGHCRADHMGVQSCVDTLREEHEVFTGNRSTEKRNIQMQGANPQKRRPNIGSDAVLENVSDVEDNCSDGLPLEQQQLSFECTVCNSFKSYSRSVMRTHLIQELDFESMTCNLCQFVAGKMTAMQKHFEVTHGGQTMDFAVSVDPKHEKVISTLLDAQEANIRKTKQTTHGNGNSSSSSSSNVEAPQVETEKRQERGAVTRYFCPSCSSTFKDAGLLKRHLETHLCRQTHKCNLCGASFSGMPHLRRHHSAKHHPHPFQEPKEEDDTKLDAFIDWVIKILPEQVVDDGHLMRPVTLTCSKNDCQMKFSNLKKFCDHFRRHVEKSSSLHRDVTRKRQRTRSRSSSSSSSIVSHHELLNEEQEEEEMLPLSMVAVVHSDDESTSLGPVAKYLCPFCDFKSKRCHRARDHILRHYKYKLFHCGYCGTECSTKEEVHEHCYKHHKNMPVRVVRIPIPENLAVHKVGVKEIVLVKEMVDEEVHVEQQAGVSGGRFTCVNCDFSSNLFRNAQYHCQNDHELATCIKIRDAKDWNNSENINDSVEQRKREGDWQMSAVPKPSQSQDCPLCHATLPDKPTWLKHFTEEHQTKYLSDARKDNSARSSKGKKVVLGLRSSQNNSAKRQAFAYHCKHCPYVAESFIQQWRHWEMCHKHLELQYERVRNQVTLLCKVCNTTLRGWEVAKEHVAGHVHRFKCPYCPKTSAMDKMIRIHCSHKHAGKKVLVTKNTKWSEQRKRMLKNLIEVEYHQLSSVPNSAQRHGPNVVPAPSSVISPQPSTQHSSPKEAEVITVNDDDDDDDDDEGATTEPFPVSSSSSSRASMSPPGLPALDPPSVCPSPPRDRKSVARKSTGKPGNKGVKRKRDQSTFWWWCSPKYQWLMEEFPYGFSYYGARPSPVDFGPLTVYTHFKGVQNTTVSAQYLSEVFNLFPVVVVEDIMMATSNFG